jgi:hypothetical protein
MHKNRSINFDRLDDKNKQIFHQSDNLKQVFFQLIWLGNGHNLNFVYPETEI